MFAGGLSSMVGDGIKDDDTDANAGMILNFLGNQVSFFICFYRICKREHPNMMSGRYILSFNNRQ